MRYAIVSDIHANLQAWKAVLLDIGSSRIDRLICLGDVVGYGPDPAAVLESVYKHAHDVALGNHDAAVCGKLSAALFNEAAAGIVRWTRTQLNLTAMGFLKSLPLTLSGPHFRCSHGDFGKPAAFHYVIDPADALPSWDAVPDHLLFTGHSHDPGIFILGRSGHPHRVGPQDFALEDGKRFLVNAGSVGQPRDGDTRACYCIYDSTTQAVYWRRIPFDLDAYRQRLDDAGIDAGASYFLQADPRAALPPVRTLLSFSPPLESSEQARDVVEVAELATLHRAVKRWKQVTALTVAGTLLVLGGGAAALWHHASRAVTIAPPGWPVPPAVMRPAGERNLLSFPDTHSTTPQPLHGWRIDLGDRRYQAVAWDPHTEGGLFRLDSTSGRHRLRVESPAFQVAQGMRFRLEVLTRGSPETRGTIGTDITLLRELDGTPVQVPHFGGKVPNMPRRGGWMLAQETFAIPAGGSAMTIALHGAFEGRIEVRGFALTRVE